MPDVVIIGGGVAGCAAAIALRLRGIEDVLVVEARDYRAFEIGETIPPEARRLLQHLQVWEDFVEAGHEPCFGSRSCWGDESVGHNDALFNVAGPGWHLDRRKFGARLAAAAEAGGAALARNAEVVGAIRAPEGGFWLDVETSGERRRIEARVVVDATGARCRFARLQGARRIAHDRLLWIGALFDCPPDFSSLTMLEAVEHGWWYAARVPGERAIVAIATDAETNKRALLHRPDRWREYLELTLHMRIWLAGLRLREDEPMFVRAAPSQLLNPVCGPGWFAVGDAASAFDPLASQGVYKALLEGLEVAAAVEAASPDYAAGVRARFADYLKVRDYFYDRERRWPSSPFWRNRRRRLLWPRQDLGVAT